MPLFHDLCWHWQDSGVQTQRERVVMAVRLGIDSYALSYEVGDGLSDRDRCSLPPLNLSALQGGNSDLQDALRMQHGLPWKHSGHTDIQQLTRLTLATEDSSAAAQAFTGTQAVAATYDLTSIRPQSERVFQQACTSLEVDVISLDLAKRLPFKLKPSPLQAALKRGLHFEICYAPALREETARRNLFVNALALSRATRGKGIIISSSARSAFELRGPYDVINMATLFGLSEQDAKAAITKNCAAVIAHAQSRRAYKGAILIEPIESSSQQAASATPPVAAAQATKQKQQAGQPLQHSGNSFGGVHKHKMQISPAQQTQQLKLGRNKKRKQR